MNGLAIDLQITRDEKLPPFSITVDCAESCAIYSDTDRLHALVEHLHSCGLTVFDGKDGLYERLTVEANLKFYRNWFGFKMPLADLLVLFRLSQCAKVPLHACSHSEKQRVRYAKFFLMQAGAAVFIEPVQAVDKLSVCVFKEMLSRMMQSGKSVLLLVSNMEHAFLLGNSVYKLHECGLEVFEEQSAAGQDQADTEEPTLPFTSDLFKISAKIEDKVILFDPTEIDYIESQDGKAFIRIDGESFALDSSLAAIEKKLEMYGFYRCHRSYIVNLQKVREIITWSKNTYSLRLNNKEASTIPLSRAKVQDIQEIFSVG